MHGTGGGILGDRALGAVAGAAGIWVMDRVDWFNYRHEDPEARRRGPRACHRAQGGGGCLAPGSPPRSTVRQANEIHDAIGIGPAAVHGGTKGRVPGLGADRGLRHGLGLFLAQDELAGAAAGFPPPVPHPWQAHARRLVAHPVLWRGHGCGLQRVQAGHLSVAAPEPRGRT